PDESTDQLSARSPTIVLPGPSLTRPRKRRETSARSAGVRAPNGLAFVARPSTPSTYGRPDCPGGVGSLPSPEECSVGARAATENANSATVRAPIRARSRNLTADPAGSASCRPWADQAEGTDGE